MNLPRGSSLRCCCELPLSLGVEKPVLLLKSSGFCAENPVLLCAPTLLLLLAPPALVVVLALVPLKMPAGCCGGFRMYAGWELRKAPAVPEGAGWGIMGGATG